ncbi:MAG: hypothetical protein SNJ69_17355 [Chloroflexaceae bacterium]
MRRGLEISVLLLLAVMLMACAAAVPAPTPTPIPTSEGETVQIIVIVQDSLAAALKGQSAPTAASRTVLEAAPNLRPLDPGASEPILARTFVADTTADAAAALVSRLQQTPGVESAYLKPPDALP